MGPGPEKYSCHKKMTERRSISTERNAYCATIGNEPKAPYLKDTTPGPNNYNTISRKSIGDHSSVKCLFTKAIRPISAKPG